MATVNCLVTKILQNIFLCVQQKKKSYRFGTTVTKFDRIKIFGWTIPLFFLTFAEMNSVTKNNPPPTPPLSFVKQV